MNAILLAMAVCGQYFGNPTHSYGRTFSVYHAAWFYAPSHSPWNQAVAELRSARATKQRSLSPETINRLKILLTEKQYLWAELVESSPSDKPMARDAYLKAKAKLNRAQLDAARELR
jgi:hypothetical protein